MLLTALILCGHFALALLGVPYSKWVAREAKLDVEMLPAGATPDMTITAGLRRRNTRGLFWSHLCYFVSSLLMVGLVTAVYERVLDARLAFVWMLVIASIRSIAVQLILLWLSFCSRSDRLKIRDYLSTVVALPTVVPGGKRSYDPPKDAA